MSIRANDMASEIHTRIWLNYEMSHVYCKLCTLHEQYRATFI